MLRPYRPIVVSLVAALTAVAATLGPAAVAQASDATLRATIIAFNPTANRDEAAIRGGLTALKHHRSKPVIVALSREAADIHSLLSKLTRQRASSTRGRRGKAEVIRGLGLIASGDSSLARATRRASHGQRVARATLIHIEAITSRGRVYLRSGLVLLS